MFAMRVDQSEDGGQHLIIVNLIRVSVTSPKT